MFLKAIYDFFSSTSTVGKVSAILASLKCILAVTALTYNLADGDNEHVAPTMFVGVFSLAMIGNFIAACASGTSKVDRLLHGFGVGASAATAAGIVLGLLLEMQKKTCGIALIAAQAGSSLFAGVAAFFRPSVAQQEDDMSSADVTRLRPDAI